MLLHAQAFSQKVVLTKFLEHQDPVAINAKRTVDIAPCSSEQDFADPQAFLIAR